MCYLPANCISFVGWQKVKLPVSWSIQNVPASKLSKDQIFRDRLEKNSSGIGLEWEDPMFELKFKLSLHFPSSQDQALPTIHLPEDKNPGKKPHNGFEIKQLCYPFSAGFVPPSNISCSKLSILATPKSFTNWTCSIICQVMLCSGGSRRRMSLNRPRESYWRSLM